MTKMKNNISSSDHYGNYRRPFLTIVRNFMIVSLAFTLVSCATPITRKDEVRAIKKIAVVSLSFNKYIYNYKAGPKLEKERKLLQEKADKMKQYTGKTDDTTQASYEQLLNDTSKTYMDALKEITHWEVIPIEKVKDMPAYQAITGETTEEQYFAPILPFPGTKYFNPFRPRTYKANVEKNRKTHQDLTELCKKLDVDAVIVLRTIVAYEPAGMQLLGGLGKLLASKKSKAKPLVGTAISVVTKAGISAVFTGAKVEFKGKAVPMMQTGVVNFTGDDQAILESYSDVIQASATDLVKTINKELAAK